MANDRASLVYYNEINPYKAQWLRNLIAAGHLPAGFVDTRSIEDVTPEDVRGYGRAHFFAGIGGWGLALARVRWPREAGIVWTCGCPCQPFSAAGKRAGFDDERHLWPAQHWLIDQCGPDVLFGEQVASRDALTWLDLVQTDMEASGYAGGATDIPIAGVGGPQKRSRLWLTYEALGDADSTGLEVGRRQSGEVDDEAGRQAAQRPAGLPVVSGSSLADDTSSRRREERAILGRLAAGDRPEGVSAGPAPSLADGGAGPTNGYWGAADWLLCNDPGEPVWRPVEPGTFPLAHGVSGRVGRLRAYGETISPVVAEAVARAYLEVRGFL